MYQQLFYRCSYLWSQTGPKCPHHFGQVRTSDVRNIFPTSVGSTKNPSWSTLVSTLASSAFFCIFSATLSFFLRSLISMIFLRLASSFPILPVFIYLDLDFSLDFGLLRPILDFCFFVGIFGPEEIGIICSAKIR